MTSHRALPCGSSQSPAVQQAGGPRILAGMWAIILDCGICAQQHHPGVSVIGINPTSPVPKSDSQNKARLMAKAFFQNQLIYRDRVVLICWVAWAPFSLEAAEPMGDNMKRDFAVGGDNAAAQACRWFSVLRSLHHDGTSPSARRKRQLGGACCGVLDGVCRRAG